MTRVCAAVVLWAAVQISGNALWAQSAASDHYVSPWKTPWKYEESSRWSQLDPAYAACDGKEQSPIDVRNAKKSDLTPLRFESQAVALRHVINNAHTIRVNYRPSNQNFLVAEGKRYELTQFHFHHPSEELIEGKAYPMEVHLMYQSSDGKVAGVTVFVQRGHANATIQKIWDHMPKTEGQTDVDGEEISPGELLPRDTGAYFSYAGSVTAPPCTEGVMWFVFKMPVELSSAQIEAFARLYPHDVRPVQPLNGRVVQASQ